MAIYGSDVLTGGTASASSFRVGDPPAEACDDNATTYWISDVLESLPQWWKYDLGSGNAKAIRKMTLETLLEGGHADFKDFTLHGSNNDSDWDLIYTGQKADDDNVETFLFENATAYRYYRVTCTTVWSGYDYTLIEEIEMMVVTAWEVSVHDCTDLKEKVGG